MVYRKPNRITKVALNEAKSVESKSAEHEANMNEFNEIKEFPEHLNLLEMRNVYTFSNTEKTVAIVMTMIVFVAVIISISLIVNSSVTNKEKNYQIRVITETIKTKTPNFISEHVEYYLQVRLKHFAWKSRSNEPIEIYHLGTEAIRFIELYDIHKSISTDESAILTQMLSANLARSVSDQLAEYIKLNLNKVKFIIQCLDDTECGTALRNIKPT
jgi:hypothetical protein